MNPGSQFTEYHVRFTTVPIKALSDQEMTKLFIILFLKSDNLWFGVLCKSDLCISAFRTMRINNYNLTLVKLEKSFIFMIKLGFQFPSKHRGSFETTRTIPLIVKYLPWSRVLLWFSYNLRRWTLHGRTKGNWRGVRSPRWRRKRRGPNCISLVCSSIKNKVRK